MEPLKSLLSSKEVFKWTQEASEAFKASKQKILEAVEEGIRTFRPDRPTCLAKDWSRTGVGFNLSQKHYACKDGPPHLLQGRLEDSLRR